MQQIAELNEPAGKASLRAIPVGPNAASRTYDEGRTCADERCVTRLSVYNPSDRCWQHEEPHTYVMRLPRRRRGRKGRVAARRDG
jgi:hypothetical protein